MDPWQIGTDPDRLTRASEQLDTDPDPAIFALELQDTYKKKQFFLGFSAFYLLSEGTFTSFF